MQTELWGIPASPQQPAPVLISSGGRSAHGQPSAAARAKKLAAGAPITLDLHQLTLDRIDSDHFKASFQQDYAAGNYRETARQKTMLIAREGSAWRIVEERQE